MSKFLYIAGTVAATAAWIAPAVSGNSWDISDRAFTAAVILLLAGWLTETSEWKDGEE